jgi:hypothetical protein
MMCKKHHCDSCREKQRERSRQWRESVRVNPDGRPTRMPLEELLAELELLVGTDNPANIAQRLNYRSPVNLARRLYRNGLVDIANRFERAA